MQLLTFSAYNIVLRYFQLHFDYVKRAYRNLADHQLCDSGRVNEVQSSWSRMSPQPPFGL